MACSPKHIHPPSKCTNTLEKKTSICPFLNPLYLFLNVSGRQRKRGCGSKREREMAREGELERERLLNW